MSYSRKPQNLYQETLGAVFPSPARATEFANSSRGNFQDKSNFQDTKNGKIISHGFST